MNIAKDYYQILGVSPSASASDIRRAYLRQALLWHPDRHVGAGPEEMAMAEAWFKEIGEAYSVLSDPRLRSEYDFFRSRRFGNPAVGVSRPSRQAAPSPSSGNNSGAGRTSTDSSQSRSQNWGSSFGAYSQGPSAQASSSTRKTWKDRVWTAVYSAFVASLIFSWWQEPITHIYDSAKEAVGRVSVSASSRRKTVLPKTFQGLVKDNPYYMELKMKEVSMPDSTWFAIQKQKMK